MLPTNAEEIQRFVRKHEKRLDHHKFIGHLTTRQLKRQNISQVFETI